MNDVKRLRRSSQEKIIAGVAGGLAEYFNVDPVLMRLMFVLLVIMGGSGIILYIVLMLVMPPAGRETPDPEGAIKDAGEAVQHAAETVRKNLEDHTWQGWWADRRNLGGFILIGLGALVLAGNFMTWEWVRPDVLWPLGLVVIGVLMITSGRRK